MSDFRAVVDHVSYWRGKIHTWSTSYQFTGVLSNPIDTTACSTLLLADDKLCFHGAGSTVYGGTYECRIYNASGGTPLATYTRFDHTVYADWIAFGGNTFWGDLSGQNHCTALEVALLIEWPAGLSKTGKPVLYKKYIHAVPAPNAAPGSGEVDSTAVSDLAAQATAVSECLGSGYNLQLGSASRSPGTVRINPFLVAHQMPKGRRRKALVTASGRYTGPSLEVPQIEAD
uniref:Uncharacterized protein n=1 Tax=uncultured prokaryote TaxID=198431 RepID=A0A0H5Q772_9ZZZZ|nr:hypothetical protein [uncultured prokaryote]